MSQKVNFLGQGNKGRLISSPVRRRTGEYPPARLLLPGGLGAAAFMAAVDPFRPGRIHHITRPTRATCGRSRPTAIPRRRFTRTALRRHIGRCLDLRRFAQRPMARQERDGMGTHTISTGNRMRRGSRSQREAMTNIVCGQTGMH